MQQCLHTASQPPGFFYLKISHTACEGTKTTNLEKEQRKGIQQCNLEVEWEVEVVKLYLLACRCSCRSSHSFQTLCQPQVRRNSGIDAKWIQSWSSLGIFLLWRGFYEGTRCAGACWVALGWLQWKQGCVPKRGIWHLMRQGHQCLHAPALPATRKLMSYA